MSLKKFVGNKQFYAGVYFVLMPIVIQNVITNFVSLLDNLMVGRVGTEPMSGVAIVNQLTFVFYLGLFGLLSGINIFTAQYYGKGDYDGVKKMMKFSLCLGAVYFLIGVSVFLLFGDQLILNFIHEGSADINLENTFNYAKDYLKTIIWGLFPFAISEVYSSTLRSTKETKIPMIASVTAVLVNLTLNYILIYGKFGAPALGVVGAAIATNVSRYIECAINIIWTHSHKDKAPFAVNVYKKVGLDAALVGRVLLTSSPLFMNELLWSASVTVANQIYSERGIEVISAINIQSTASTLFNAFFLSMGIATSIIIGNTLGAGDLELAVDTDRKLIALSFTASIFFGALAFLVAPWIVELYNTEVVVKELAIVFIRILAVFMPFNAAVNAMYFTIRSGGKTVVTCLFDSCFAWVFYVSSAFILVKFTDLTIIPIFFIVQSTILIKFVIGIILVKKRIWVNNIVN